MGRRSNRERCSFLLVCASALPVPKRAWNGRFARDRYLLSEGWRHASLRRSGKQHAAHLERVG